MLLSKEMQARDEAQLPPTEAEAASGQPAGQYLNPPKQSGFQCLTDKVVRLFDKQPFYW